MAVLNLDPPPQSDDIRVMWAWMNEMYEKFSFVLQNIGEDNLEEDFFNKINGGEG